MTDHHQADSRHTTALDYAAEIDCHVREAGDDLKAMGGDRPMALARAQVRATLAQVAAIRELTDVIRHAAASGARVGDLLDSVIKPAQHSFGNPFTAAVRTTDDRRPS